MNAWSKSLQKIKALANSPRNLSQKLDRLAIAQGTILARSAALIGSGDLRDHEFSVFSQWGEDGILQYIVTHIPIPNRTFIEFGVENFSESNCRFLMMKDYWSGFVVDGSAENIEELRQSEYYWRHDISANAAFITRENINEILSKSGFESDLGLLSIDIDGVDFHVLKAISSFRPRILVAEYNALFGPTRHISVPYDAGFRRGSAHYSHLYYGASLAAITHAAEEKGLTLVGTNTAGNNAFYVRSDLLNDFLRARTVAECFTVCKFRESRDGDGRLSYLSAAEAAYVMAGMEVLNTLTGKIERL